ENIPTGGFPLAAGNPLTRDVRLGAGCEATNSGQALTWTNAVHFSPLLVTPHRPLADRQGSGYFNVGLTPIDRFRAILTDTALVFVGHLFSLSSNRTTYPRTRSKVGRWLRTFIAYAKACPVALTKSLLSGASSSLGRRYRPVVFRNARRRFFLSASPPPSKRYWSRGNLHSGESPSLIHPNAINAPSHRSGSTDLVVRA